MTSFEEQVKQNYERLQDELSKSEIGRTDFLLHHIAAIQAMFQQLGVKAND
jgi:uncharacterized protein YydD (DUF2326 family)